ncbi:MAG: hypothetical protein ACLFUS_12880 [Candidatus Sumerlaeia bacterium]
MGQAEKHPDVKKDGDYQCPNCGKVWEKWKGQEGVKKDGELYCCKGCANGTGCECE